MDSLANALGSLKSPAAYSCRLELAAGPVSKLFGGDVHSPQQQNRRLMERAAKVKPSTMNPRANADGSGTAVTL